MTNTPRGRIALGSIGRHSLNSLPGCRLFYTVTGGGPFPQDALRRDAGACMDATGLPGERNTREVKILSAHYCTPERWHSFGWVVHDDIVEVAAPVSVSMP